MIKQLALIFELIFMNPRIIDKRFKNFVQKFLKNLAVQNTANQFDTMLNETETKYNSYFGKIDDKDTMLAIQMSRTKSVDNVILEFIATMKKVSEKVAGEYGGNSTQYLQIFPHHYTEYLQVTKTNIGTLFHRVIEGLTVFQVDMGVTLLNEMTALQTKYNNARGEQQTKMGQVEAIDTDKKADRLKLASQMQDNLFDIAKLIKGQPERVNDFFSFHLLLPHKYKNDAGETVFEENTFNVPKNSQIDTGLVFTPDTLFQFYNDSNVPIIAMLSVQNEDQPIPATPIVINPDEILELKASQIGPAACMHLRLINQSTTEDGQLTIEILS